MERIGRVGIQNAQPSAVVVAEWSIGLLGRGSRAADGFRRGSERKHHGAPHRGVAKAEEMSESEPIRNRRLSELRPRFFQRKGIGNKQLAALLEILWVAGTVVKLMQASLLRTAFVLIWRLNTRSPFHFGTTSRASRFPRLR